MIKRRHPPSFIANSVGALCCVFVELPKAIPAYVSISEEVFCKVLIMRSIRTDVSKSME
ncbi:hypothetical protein PGJ_00010650 [Porphyromonas gingivalis AJW4]|nr:hypothetical protein PGJ_00010650 [Porphyromonas gingivalis AJW4]